ncbi:hypothetical protein [Reinekea blandensis]|uniref:Uncharacterized protein n=1 Tax=Reinekea blandensis MED297 TaxID=314283 RepID=A4BCV3_9GAMM|nr:hypothetical protein [Reinekea blandensis]EAR10035.1 hypothetical protein MED297_08101 [Reinekea sp. MED297] [Reinekea blandensis MED297]
MRIVSSDVTSQAAQQRTTERQQVRQEQISTLTREETQQMLDQGADILDAQQQTLLQRSRSADREASVTLELTTKHSDQLGVQTASLVSQADGTTLSHLGQSLLSTVSEHTLQGDFTIRRAGPSGTLGESADVTYVDITTIEKVTTENAIQMNTQGTVTTADGREINFLMQLDFNRLTEREQVNRFVGDVDLIDPLAINLNGESVQLSDEVFDFDLNADGTMDRIAKTSSGSGYLVFDRNGNGIIDDGTEMFGPSSGYGYQELAELDDDGNGWIDEGDAAFQKLGFWQFDDQGQSSIRSLSDVGLGALSLSRASTEYNLLSDDGELMAQVKNSGAALMEDGAVAVMQELNLRNFVTHTELGFIDDDGVELTRMNPLGFFQASTDERIQNRNDQTRVRIEGNNLLAMAGQERPLQRRNEENAPDFTVAMQGEIETQTERTIERSVQQFSSDTQQLIVQRMQAKLDVSTRVNVQETHYVWTPDAAEHRFLDNLPDGWNFDQTSEDPLLTRLKQLVEDLKDIQQQQQASLEKLDIYRQIGQFSH